MSLETIRDLLLPGLVHCMQGSSITDADLVVEDGGIVLRIPGIDEAFPVVLPEEVETGLYKDRFKPRVMGALAQAKMILDSREEPLGSRTH